MNSSSLNSVVALTLCVLLVLLIDPFKVWMPVPAQMTVLLLAVACTAAWAGFVLSEHATDERERTHSDYAGRVAYLAGIAVLTAALLVQGFSHALDPWIPVALGTMVVLRLAARLYAEYYR